MRLTMMTSSVSPQSCVKACIATAQPAVQVSGGPLSQDASAQQMLSTSWTISLIWSQRHVGDEAPSHWER